MARQTTVLILALLIILPFQLHGFLFPYSRPMGNPKSRPFMNPPPFMSTATAQTPKALETVQVELGERSYPIYIGAGILNCRPELLQQHVKGKKVLVITNDRVAPLYLDATVAALKAKGNKVEVDTLVLPDGEQHKDMETLMKILDKALESKLDRKGTLVALGGGVIGDMVGFAAAIYQRGVSFVQVPTTLMAMVDSAVGGKTAVNHPLGKNMIGAFYQPMCVFVDTDTLSTLPDRELASGVAEVIKYGLIRDAALFQWLEDNMEALIGRDPSALAYAIKRSCENKAEIVALDEKEGDAGIRATLNLGHTFGHAVETGLGYGTWLHGEAVALGMAMAADMSARLGWIDGALCTRAVQLLKRARLPVELPADSGMTLERFSATMSIDKKVADGVLRLILLRGDLGSCVFTADYDVAKLEDTIQSFC